MTAYEKLLEKYRQTKPFQGRKNDPERPLETPVKRWVQNPNWTSGGTEPFGEWTAYKFRRSGRYVIRLETDGALTMRYWGINAARLYPDGRVTVWRTTYGGDGMVQEHLPASVSVVSSSNIVAMGEPGAQHLWTRDQSHNTRVALIDHAGVTLRPDADGRWQIDGEPAAQWELDYLDRTKTREISKRFNISDFTAWFHAYTTLTDGRVEPEMLNNHDVAVAALERRDFITAFHNLEPVQQRCFGWAPSYIYRWSSASSSTANPPRITPRSVERLRLRLYEAYGAVTTTKHDTITVAQWRSRVLRNPCRAT